MKYTIIKFLFTIILAITLIGCCKENEPGGDTPTQSTILEKNRPNPKSPRAFNTNTLIEGKCLVFRAHYSQERLELNLPTHINFVEVEITNNSTTIWRGWATADVPYCNIPPLKGKYNIVCTTDNGTEYHGELSF